MKPTVEQVKQRLRLDGPEWDDQITDLIEACHAEMLAYLDRPVQGSPADLPADGIVSNAALINGQVLLVGAHLNLAGSQDGERMRNAALAVLRPFRKMGA